jgi:hypothetical protein
MDHDSDPTLTFDSDTDLPPRHHKHPPPCDPFSVAPYRGCAIEKRVQIIQVQFLIHYLLVQARTAVWRDEFP